MKVYELEHNHEGHSDAGLSFSFDCPECGQNMTVAEYPWWSAECNCGRSWRLEICAYDV